MDLVRLINRVYALLCIYEEQNEEEYRIVDKVVRITDDLLSFSHAYRDDIGEDDYNRVKKSAYTIKLLTEKPFYSNEKGFVRKTILDSTGDLGRIKVKLGGM